MGDAVIYVRFSPRPDAAESKSLETQEAACRKYCELRGMTVHEVCADPDTSAFKTRFADRPGGKRVMELVATHKTRDIVSTRMDRMFRNTADGIHTEERFRKMGVSLHLCDQQSNAMNTGTPEGRLMLKVLLMFAELWADLNSDRTSRAMLHKQRNGR